MNKLKVAVVILNWNGKGFLKKFLPSVTINMPDYAELIIADNNSSDDSISFLQQNYPHLRIVQNKKNGGFAKGYNDALKQIDAQYYVLLNSDIEVSPRWIEPIIEMMDQDPDIASAQPKILSYHQKEYFEYAGAGGGFLDAYGYPFCRGRMFDTIEQDQGQYDDITEIFWASGAAMFVRADVYWQLGGLDERFFAHQEEIDFCWRAKRQGYKIMYNGHSRVYHVGGGTLSKHSSQKTYLNIRNNLIMLYKNLPSGPLYRIIFLRLILDGIAAVKFAFGSGLSEIVAILRAHKDFYKLIPQLRKERKNNKDHKVSFIYSKLLVVEYFVHRKKYFKDLQTKYFTR
jgi:GT2 family glycosyltransferase